MSGGWYVNANDIVFWSEKEPRRAQEELPLLVKNLIYASIDPKYIRYMRFPSRDSISLMGFDGILEVAKGNSFVPEGKSFWEIGTNKNPEQKADEDYKKRSEEDLHDKDRANSTFVFVTNRIFNKKINWEEEKKKEKKWKDVRCLDAVDLAEWLHQCLAVHRWLSRRLNKRPENAFDIWQVWDELSITTKYSLTPDFFIAGRFEYERNLIESLKSEPQLIKIFGMSKDEAYAFAIASISKVEELSSRVLIIKDSNEWTYAVESKNFLILIPFFDDLVNMELAVSKGHWVIKPESNPNRKFQSNGIEFELPRPNRGSLIDALIEMGIYKENAEELVSNAKGFLMPLWRLLKEVKKPEWAKSDDYSLITALLIGAWDEGNDWDRQEVEELFGASYKDLEKSLHKWSIEDDPPVRKFGTQWQVVSRFDMWKLLSPYIDTKIIEKFGEIAVEILKETDSQRVFLHSNMLRKNIAEMLVMLSVYTDTVLKNIGTYLIEDRVSNWIEKILKDSTFLTWYSLSSLLLYFAEASPDIFLKMIENKLKGDDNTFIEELFDEREDFTSVSLYEGLLWALEVLSWNKDYVARVVLILERLSRLDPDDKVDNKSFESLRMIFLGSYPQTKLTVEEKLDLLDLLLKKEPEITWRLLLSLFPKPTLEIPTKLQKPSFRDWAKDWKPTVSNNDYSYYISGIANRIWKFANENDGEYIADLIENLEFFTESTILDLIEKLYKNIDEMLFENKTMIYESLFKLVCKQKRDNGSVRVFPKEIIKIFDDLINKLVYNNPILKNKILFEKYEYELICEPDIDITMYQDIIENKRKLALQEIWDRKGFEGIQELIKMIDIRGNTRLKWKMTEPEKINSSYIIGQLLTKLSFFNQIEDKVLQWLDSEDKKFSDIAKAFVFANYKQISNYLLSTYEKYKDSWNNDKWLKFCLCLPPEPEVLAFMQNLQKDIEDNYWKVTNCYYQFSSSKEDIESCIKKLIKSERPIDALDVIAYYLYINLKCSFNQDFLAKILEQVAKKNFELIQFGRINGANIEIIFNYLQKSSEISPERLIYLESSYISYFTKFKTNLKIKPIALIQKILSDPEFFVYLILINRTKYDTTIKENRLGLSDDQMKNFAKNIPSLFNLIEELPGQTGENIDEDKLINWVKRARDMCKQENILSFCDSIIGSILSNASFDEDGYWPHKAVREILEEVESADLEDSIAVTIFNKRANVLKPLGTSDERERDRFKLSASEFKIKYPRTAVLLDRIISDSERYTKFGNNLKTNLDFFT
ncbi:hypothetical protein Thena_1104 [Thermodesulfobium narugense DSM 14796]|uniref:Uncharacterized protein n=1 Tax=Thermodesulfobium narugense DSM 14796 TaxID=747365 RepID=M1E8Y4_9BACT|nr:hypothetical protein [Thermodesulfobium narugense]AEE14729.1 hypothetical protein Thena_1104 [Thermodesulfobium narugense DSM 14796]